MSKQMSATSCSGQAVHPVELLRDGKGVFGIIDHGDDDHEPENLAAPIKAATFGCIQPVGGLGTMNGGDRQLPL